MITNCIQEISLNKSGTSPFDRPPLAIQLHFYLQSGQWNPELLAGISVPGEGGSADSEADIFRAGVGACADDKPAEN